MLYFISGSGSQIKSATLTTVEERTPVTCSCSEDLLQTVYSMYSDSAHTFVKLRYDQNGDLGPSSVLYLSEQEVATLLPSFGISQIGSDDATTCHIVIAREIHTGVVAAAHFNDLYNSEIHVEDFEDVLRDAVNFSINEYGSDAIKLSFDLFIIGGYCSNEQRNFSEQFSSDLLWSFYQSKLDYNLQIACISRLNTTIDPVNGIPRPAVCGMACDMKTGAVFSRNIPLSERGPERYLRSWATSCTDHLVNVFDIRSKRIVIHPFRLRNNRVGWTQTLALGDTEFLQQNSTSPLVEPAHFIAFQRNRLRYALDNSDLMSTVFKQGTLRFRCDSGQWIPSH